MYKLIIMLALVFPPLLEASSTFVGNGGSILDSELRGTIHSLELSIEQAMREKSEIGVCACQGENRQCALLKSLNNSEKDYCQKFIEDHSPGLLKLVRDRNAYTFQWSPSALRSEGQGRSFDAMANASTRTITFDENRFAKMSVADRVQLLAHEFLHLYPIEGEVIGDDGEIGPFKGESGKRRLLDVMGAAYAVSGMKNTAVPLKASKGSSAVKNLYIHAMGGSRDIAPGFKRSSLMEENIATGSLGVTWFPRVTDNFGLFAASYTESGSKTHFNGQLESELELFLIEVGATYRLLPINSGYRWLDSTQIFFNGALGFGGVEHTFKDDFVNLKKKKTLSSASLGLSLQIPLIWNFWFTASPGLRYMPYKIEDLDIESKTVDYTTQFGVTYGIQI